MSSCDFLIFINALACSIAKEKTDDEITRLSISLIQLGTSLGTIVTNNQYCEKQKAEKDKTADQDDENNNQDDIPFLFF